MNGGEEVGTESVERKVIWRSFRGHDDGIRCIYRSEWCLVNDFVAIELVDGQIVIWNVGTSQTERRFGCMADAVPFAVDRSLAVCNRRSDCFGVERAETYSVYDLQRSSGHLGAHPLVLNVAAVLKANECSDLVAALSLLMDWDIHSDAVHFEFVEHFKRCVMANGRRARDDGAAIEWPLSLVRDIRPCFGYFGDYGSMTMLFPICCRNGGKWKMHCKLTAVYSTAMRALAVRLKEVIAPQITMSGAANGRMASNGMHGLRGRRESAVVTPLEEQREKRRLEAVQFLEQNVVQFYAETVPQSLSGFVESSRKTVRLVTHCVLLSRAYSDDMVSLKNVLQSFLVKKMCSVVHLVVSCKWSDHVV